jgi:hypothetical protein
LAKWPAHSSTKKESSPKAGERRQFIVRYRVTPANGLRMLKNKFGERIFFSENWPNNARQRLPMIEHQRIEKIELKEKQQLFEI